MSDSEAASKTENDLIGVGGKLDDEPAKAMPKDVASSGVPKPAALSEAAPKTKNYLIAVAGVLNEPAKPTPEAIASAALSEAASKPDLIGVHDELANRIMLLLY